MVDGSANIWQAIDKNNFTIGSIWKDYDPLEWIIGHQYVLIDIEKRIMSKRI